MKISLNWLQEFVNFTLVDKKALETVVVGLVKSLKKHPDADGLQVAQINIGEETVQIVCGGINLKEKMYVPVAKVGSVLPGNFEIKKGKIRGEESNGMICAQEELKMGHGAPREIWSLEGKHTPGTPLIEALKLDKAVSPEELGSLLTKHTAEVEEIIENDQYLHRTVTGKLVDYEKIADSDKLHKGTFDIGWKTVQIIFGSVFELKKGEILPIALNGANLPSGPIKSKEIMGVKTEGMVCSDTELGIENSSEGLTRFPSETPLGMPVAQALMLETYSIDVDNKSLTHRPDLWGHYGFAREVSAILKKPLKPLDDYIKHQKEGKESLKVTIKDDEVCPRFSGCILTGISIEESPQWLKSRLLEAGLHPINNIVDVTNYVMVELGAPMHAYDRKIVGSDELIIRAAKKDEELILLDGSSLKMRSGDPIVCNKNNEPLGLAGIKGGLKSGINDNTTEVILEAANWNPVTIRKTSTFHGVRTDASQRFEKSLDPALTEKAIKRAINLIEQLCPSAKLTTKVTSVGKWKEKELKITISPERICKKIGVDIPTKDIVDILTRLEFSVSEKKNELTVSIPSFRSTKDVDIQDDIIEEIARIYGYDQIKPILPELHVKLPQENTERKRKHEAKRIMAYALGFDEIYNYSFNGTDEIEKCLLTVSDHVELENYLSADQTHLRTSLVPNMLKRINENLKNLSDFKLFEIGRTYIKEEKSLPKQEKVLCAAIVIQKKSIEEAFYAVKGAAEEFLNIFTTQNVRFTKSTTCPPYAHPKKCLSIVVNGNEIGNIFTLNPIVKNNFDIENRVAFFEINYTQLHANDEKVVSYSEIPKFQGSNFDISVIVDEQTETADLQELIRKADKKLIAESTLFDIYRHDERVGKNKKAMAFSVSMQSDEGTISEKQLQKTVEQVIENLKKVGEVRGK